MLADGWHAGDRFRKIESRGLQCRYRPHRSCHIEPTISGRQLRMVPDMGHVVDYSIGNTRLIQTADHLLQRHSRKDFGDTCGKLLPVFRPSGVIAVTRVLRQLRVFQHLFTERPPLAVVLQPQHHRFAIPDWKRAVGVNGGMGSTRSRRGLCPIITVIQGVAHPLHQTLQHGNVNVSSFFRPRAQ